MAIKKYRVAHGVESVILGVIICIGLFVLFSNRETTNKSIKREIIQLNNIYKEKLNKEKGLDVEAEVQPFSEEHISEVNEIITAARELREKINYLKMKCEQNGAGTCQQKMNELIGMLGY